MGSGPILPNRESLSVMNHYSRQVVTLYPPLMGGFDLAEYHARILYDRISQGSNIVYIRMKYTYCVPLWCNSHIYFFMPSIEFYEVSIKVYINIVVQENVKSDNSIYKHVIKMFIT